MPNRELCLEVVRQLWPYLDGALPDEWQERVAAHLDECVTCRSHFDFERRFLDAIRESDVAGDGFDALRTRVVAALAADGMTMV